MHSIGQTVSPTCLKRVQLKVKGQDHEIGLPEVTSLGETLDPRNINLILTLTLTLFLGFF